MAPFLRYTLCPARLGLYKLPAAFPYKSSSFGWSKCRLSRDSHDQSAKPRIRTVADESDLTGKQLEELFAGRFPADTADEVIHLSNLSHCDFNKIANAFDTSGNDLEDDMQPPGHLFLDREFSKISVHFAPTIIHESAIQKIEEAVWDVIKSNVQNHDQLFDLRINSAAKCPPGFTTKVPDITISHAPDPTTLSSPFFLAVVGFSESYKDLLKTMKFWLDGHEKIRMAILVEFQEDPCYDGKKSFNALPEEVVANAEYYLNNRDGFKMDDTRGVLQAYGAPLVGRITAFLEVWERKPDSSDIVLRGERVNFYDSSKHTNPPNLALDFEAFGIPVKELRSKKFNLTWGSWITKVARARRELAWDRFRTLLYTHTVKQKGKASGSEDNTF